MKNMSPIFMHTDTFYLLTINIAAQMRPFVDYQTTLPCPVRPISQNRPKQTSANYQIIKMFHSPKVFRHIYREEAILHRKPHSPV